MSDEPQSDPIASLRIDRSSTAERVADVLRESIIQGDLPPGTPLREQQLVGSFDVSRNTIREAFRLLSRERLVVYQMHRGVEVRGLGLDDIRDIYRTRRSLELAAVAHSANAPRELLVDLLRLVEEAEEAARIDDWKQVATLNIVFHQQLVDLIGSVRISAFFRVVDAELRLAFAVVERAEAFFHPFIARNRRLAELLLAGDRATAGEELEAYLDEAELMISQGIAST